MSIAILGCLAWNVVCAAWQGARRLAVDAEEVEHRAYKSTITVGVDVRRRRVPPTSPLCRAARTLGAAGRAGAEMDNIG